MMMMTINTHPLCGCKQPPRTLIKGYGVCRCKHLIYRPNGIATPWNPAWTAVADPTTRRLLIEEARAVVGTLRVDAETVADAAAAARLAGEGIIANDIEYEQWVLSLEM